MSKPFRFVHSADLHLDSPLKSLARRDADLASFVAKATREALNRTIDLCLTEQVDALLLAGDIYDSHNPSVSAVGFFHRELNRLKDSGIRVFLIRGNHDHHAKLTAVMDLPEHVVEFVGNKKIEILKEHDVAIHGVSFKEEHATESALRGFKAPDDNCRNIALLHTSLGGSEGHDVYAPCSVAELDAMGFDYWALGHIHKREVTGRSASIVMPGTPQGRDMGETGIKSVSLVTMNEKGQCDIEERVVSPIAFERITVDLTACTDSDTESLLKFATNEFLQQAAELKAQSSAIDRWIIRVECRCRADQLYPLQADPEHTDEAFRLAAEVADGVHVDRIRYHGAETDHENPSTDASQVLELKSIVLNHLDDTLLAEISNKEFDDLIKLLPSKVLRDGLNDSPERRQQSITELQTKGVNELLALVQVESTRSE